MSGTMREPDRTHTDWVSLVWGVIFCGFGLYFLAEATDVVDVDFKIIWPLLVIGAGLGVLIAAVARTRRRY